MRPRSAERPSCLFLCAVVSPRARSARGIETDSPAARRKTLALAGALRSVGVRVLVLTLGRGRIGPGSRRDGVRFEHDRGIQVVSAGFSPVPLVSHLVSAVSIARMSARFVRRGDRVVVYNFLLYYLPAVLLARARGASVTLDLEDGPCVEEAGLRGWLKASGFRLFSLLCNGKVLLAGEGLRPYAGGREALVAYGCSEPSGGRPDWTAPRVRVVLSGSLFPDRGGTRVFEEAVRKLFSSRPGAADAVEFHVCGFGPCAGRMRRLAEEFPGNVRFHGRLDEDAYRELLASSQVGLVLLVPESPIGQVTFPSKAVEFASNGLLVVATPVPDLRSLFAGDGALFLRRPYAGSLVEALDSIVSDRAAAAETAARGACRITERLSQREVGVRLQRFLETG